VNNQTYRTDLTDRQWQIIKDLLPAPKSGGRPRTICLRQAFNAMLYLLTTGCQWKMLPQGYPHWRTVYGSFRDWQKDGTWERLHHRLRRWARRQARRRPRPTAGSLDSQSIKSTAVAGVRGFESFKRVMGRKRHIIVDTLGFLLAVCITPANVSDQRFRPTFQIPPEPCRSCPCSAGARIAYESSGATVVTLKRPSRRRRVWV